MDRAGADAGGLRILSGERRGKKLSAVRGWATRPTASRVRESIFNIISANVHNSIVLDLYAGTGILGIEALSRGARFAFFVDNSPAALSIIRKNITACRFENRAQVRFLDIVKEDWRLSKNNEPFNLVFMDPPYNKGLVGPTLLRLHEANILAHHALIVVEHDQAEPPGSLSACFEQKDQRKYGKTFVSFVYYHPLGKEEGFVHQL